MDRFLDRVAQDAGKNVLALEEVRLRLLQCGLTADAQTLERVIRQQSEIAIDCQEDTDVGGPPHPRTPPGARKPTDR